MSSKTKKAASGKAVQILPHPTNKKNEDIESAREAVTEFMSKLNPTLCYDPALEYFKMYTDDDAEALDNLIDALMVSDCREAIEEVCGTEVYALGISAMHRIIRVLDRMVPLPAAEEVKKSWSLISKTL